MPFIFTEVNALIVIKRLHLSGLALMWFSLNHPKRSLVELSNFSKTMFKFMSEVYGELSSAELAMSHLQSNKNKSRISILKRRGSNIEPCGAPYLILVLEL